MRAVLCKNVPAVRDFRDVICRAAWKNPGSVCEHVAPFPVFPEIFSDFLPFGGGILVEISQPGEEKWPPGSFFPSSGWCRTGRFREILVLRLAKNGLSREIFVLRLAQKWPFSRNFCPSAGIKLAISWEFPSFGWHKNGLSREILLLWLA